MSYEPSARRQVTRVRMHVDLFAYTLLTLSFGWGIMNLLQGWRLSLGIQTGIILVCAVIWTLFGSLFMLAVRRVCE